MLGAHGLRGRVRVRLFGDASEALAAGARLTLSGEAAAEHVLVALEPGRRDEWRATLEGVRDRDQAEALRGCRLWLDPAQLPELPEGEYYAFQLVGCELVDEDGAAIGRVGAIWETGASDLLVVEAAGGAERLVPAALLRRVDLEARRAVVELVPGLLEDS